MCGVGTSMLKMQATIVPEQTQSRLGTFATTEQELVFGTRSNSMPRTSDQNLIPRHRRKFYKIVREEPSI